MPEEVNSQNYNRLRIRVAQILTTGKERARQAVERETLQSYWGVGRILHEHLLAYKQRAEYGARVVSLLARDIQIGERQLYKMLQFFRAFPILPSWTELGWGHYRALLGVPAEAERLAYLEGAVRGGWSVRELEAHVKAGALAQPTPETGKSPTPSETLPALRGQLYTYKLRESASGGGLRLDLGFGIHPGWPLTGLAHPQPGKIVASIRTAPGADRPDAYRFQEVRERRAAFYTYCAKVIRVVDGDTVWLDVDCGFGIWSEQKVRFRGIDAPEIATAAGLRSRDFVSQSLADLPCVVVTTTKPDKYDRYLADVFYLPGSGDPEAVLRQGVFLNRELLKTGLAKRV